MKDIGCTVIFVCLWYWGNIGFCSIPIVSSLNVWYNSLVKSSRIQFSSVAQWCQTLWDPMDCSMPGFPVYHQLPKLAQTHVHWVSDAIQPSVVPFCLQSFPASESFPVSQLFASVGQNIGVPASASALPMNIQDWFPLGLTGLISHKRYTCNRV